MKHFNEQISKAKTIAITGHIHPDGDCIGSCLALKQYILDNYSGKKVDVYLESISTEFRFLSHAQEIITESKDDESYDLFFVLDCGSEDRGFESLHPPHFLFLPDSPVGVNIGMSPSGKAPDFDSGIRRFESCHPSHRRSKVTLLRIFCIMTR